MLPSEEASGAKLLDHSRSDAATKTPKSGPSSRAPLPKWPRPSSAPPRLQHEYEYSPPNTPSTEELESHYFEPPARLDGGNTQGQHVAHSPSPVQQPANQPSAEKHGKRRRKRSLDVPDSTVDHILDPRGLGLLVGHRRGRHPPVSNPERSSSTPPHHTGQNSNSLHPRADLTAQLPRGRSGSSTAAVATSSPTHGGLVFTTSEEDSSTQHADRRITSGTAGSWRDEFPPPVGPDGRIHFGSFGDGGPSTPGSRSRPPGQGDDRSLTIPQTNAQAPPPLPSRPSPRPRLAIIPAVPRMPSRPVTSPRPSPTAQKRPDPASSAQDGQGITSHNRANELMREHNAKNEMKKDHKDNAKRKQKSKRQNSKRGKRRLVWSVKASAGAGGVNPYPRLSHRKGRKAMARKSAPPPPPPPPSPASPHKEENAGIDTHPPSQEQPHSPSKDYQFSPSQDQSSSS